MRRENGRQDMNAEEATRLVIYCRHWPERAYRVVSSGVGTGLGAEEGMTVGGFGRVTLRVRVTLAVSDAEDCAGAGDSEGKAVGEWTEVWAALPSATLFVADSSRRASCICSGEGIIGTADATGKECRLWG